MDQVHGDRVVRSSTTCRGRAIRCRLRRPGHRRRRRRPRRSSWPTACRCSCPTPRPGVVAAVHAGRLGTRADVVLRALEAMASLGADPAACEVLLGPAVCGACYEVPADMQREFAGSVPLPLSTTRWGTAGPRPAGRSARPARRPGRAHRRRRPVHPRVAGPLLPPPGRRHRSDGGGRTVRRVTDARTRRARGQPGERPRAGLGAACAAAGRDPASVTLVAVTKTWPADDVRRLAASGSPTSRENRDQEAADKVAACRDLAARVALRRPGPDQQGPLGRELCRRRARRRPERARRRPRPRRPSRPAGGCACSCRSASPDRRPRPDAAVPHPADVSRSARAVAASRGPRPRRGDGRRASGRRPGAAFARLEEVAGAVRAAHPAATWVSAGMSGDFGAAIRHGATHVRIGSALLGNRPPLR